MKRAALFFDIDGTLLDNKTWTIPESAIKALKKARENGHYLFINTGRTFSGLSAVRKQFEFDGYQCGCGCHLVYQGEVLLEQHVERERGKEILKKMRECNVFGAVEALETIYFPTEKTTIPLLEWEKIYYIENGMGELVDFDNAEFTYDKLFLFTDEKSDMETFSRFVCEDMEVIDRGNGNYEVAQKAFTKGTACELMRKMLGLELDQIYVFGDSMNDLEMFRFAKHTIAMGEHAKGLEPYTEFITKNVEDDGIAFAMKYYGLI
ncbi:MAG: Cof-type HAD-IIB family hydrolase [Schaedlerella sp.]|nr:Cof-type HAD-IIB family hydrolase [Schaedlerella sp.]